MQLYVPRSAREELKALGPEFQKAYSVSMGGHKDLVSALCAPLTPRPGSGEAKMLVFIFHSLLIAAAGASRRGWRREGRRRSSPYGIKTRSLPTTATRSCDWWFFFSAKSRRFVLLS